ncbi:MAG: hypothetical protein LLF76_01130 [Planctomycetaceae bacterium]|nr:hypothetical protein [Planctomycetaceae bacterium]
MNASRFVVLQHTGRETAHWDLMLEDGGVLMTWRLDVPPEQIADEAVHAKRIHDHAVRFLDYEGPVQKNTGQVKRVDEGTCKWISKKTDVLAFLLDGRGLKGQFELKHNSGTDWLFCTS